MEQEEKDYHGGYILTGSFYPRRTRANAEAPHESREQHQKQGSEEESNQIDVEPLNGGVGLDETVEGDDLLRGLRDSPRFLEEGLYLGGPAELHGRHEREHLQVGEQDLNKHRDLRLLRGGGGER